MSFSRQILLLPWLLFVLAKWILKTLVALIIMAAEDGPRVAHLVSILAVPVGYLMEQVGVLLYSLTEKAFVKTSNQSKRPNIKVKRVIGIWVLVAFWITMQQTADVVAFSASIPMPSDSRVTIERQDRPVHFSFLGDMKTPTGKGVIVAEIPIGPAVCLSRNLRDAMQTTYASDHWMWAKGAPTLREDVAEMENLMKLMQFDSHLDTYCKQPQFKIILKDATYRKLSKGTPGKDPSFDAAIVYAEDNCWSTRLGLSCSMGRLPRLPRSKREADWDDIDDIIEDIVSHRTKRSPRFNNFVRKVAGNRQAFMQLLRNSQMKLPKLDGFNVITPIVNKAARFFSLSSSNPVMAVLQIGGAITNALAYMRITSRLNRLSAHVQELETKLGVTIKVLVKALQALEDQNRVLQLQAATLEVNNIKNNIRDTFQALVHEQFPVHLFNDQTFQKQIKELKNRAKENGDELMYDNHLNLIQGKTGFTYEDTGNLNIFLEVDLHDPELEMNIYRFYSAPIKTKYYGNVQLRNQITHIAATKTLTMFVTMTHTEFNQCSLKHNARTCPKSTDILINDPTLRGYDQSRCVMAILASNDEAISAHCQFEEATTVEFLTRIASNQFLGYSRRTLKISVTCPNLDIPIYAQAGEGLFILTAPDGCKITAPAQYVMTAYELSPLQTYHDRAWSPPAAFAMVANMMQTDGELLIQERLTLEELQYHLENKPIDGLDTSNPLVVMAICIPTAILATLITVAIITFRMKIYKTIRNKLRQTPPNRQSSEVVASNSNGRTPQNRPRTEQNVYDHIAMSGVNQTCQE